MVLLLMLQTKATHLDCHHTALRKTLLKQLSPEVLPVLLLLLLLQTSHAF
jgi:hypothetical protein